MSQSGQPAPNPRWIAGVSAKQSVREAAHIILQSRLSGVSYWLPLAAQKSDEDVEYVHQLRISTRRAVEALRVFSDLIPQEFCADLRDKLIRVRLAADEARNLDVFSAEFVRCSELPSEGTAGKIAAAIKQRRRAAQQPIVAIYDELVAAKFNEQIDGFLQQINCQGEEGSKLKFGRQAPRYLKPLLKKFIRASKADLLDDEALHKLRIRTKKLRYTMEIVEAAFRPCFRKRLYRRVAALQDLMGAVNDRATAKTFFAEWIAKTDDAELKAFFLGLLLAETRAHEDLRQAFHAVWTPEAAKELQRQFRDCCQSS